MQAMEVLAAEIENWLLQVEGDTWQARLRRAKLAQDDDTVGESWWDSSQPLGHHYDPRDHL